MQLLQVKFRNINSYGNRWQIIDFDSENPGLYQICGENGTGKSTISQVLKLGLYGKVQGKNIEQCVNRINKRGGVGGEVYMSFKTRLGLVEVERKFSPNKFSLKIDNNKYEQSGAKNVQAYLEDSLVGIPQKIFNNSISLSINDFKSFLKMSPEDKREIVDKIFGLESINLMKKVLSDEVKLVKDNLRKIDDKIRFIDNTINNSIYELGKIEERLKNDNSKRIEELKEKLQDFSLKKSPINESKEKVKEYNKKVKEAEQEYLNKIYKCRNAIDASNKELKFYESGKCPTCGSPFDGHEHIEKIEKLKSNLSNYQSVLNQLNEKYEKVKVEINKVNKKNSELDEKLIEVESNLRSIRSEIQSLEGFDKLENQTDAIRRIIENNRLELDNLQKERDSVSKLESINSIIAEILGEKGLKKSIIESIVKPMNVQVNSMLEHLDLPFKVEFDGQFNAKLKQFATEIGSEELSTGQLKLLDFAVLISMIKMLKTKFPTLNILFLDEIFSSLDQNNIFKIISILRKLTKEYSINIMVINHAPLPTEMFDWTITTLFKDNFSNLKVEKCQ